jgi:ABC-2 type transport system permease protein
MAFLKNKRNPETSTETPAALMVAGSNHAASQNARNIPLIIAREYKARVQKRSFVVGTIILVVLVIVAAFIPTVIEIISSNSQSRIAVVNTAGQIAGQNPVSYLDSQLNTTLDSSGQLRPVATGTKKQFEIGLAQPDQVAALRQQVRDGKLDAVLVIGRTPAEDLSFDYFSSGSLSGATAARIQSASAQLTFLDKLARLGIPQSQLGTLFQGPSLRATSTNDEKSGRTPAETGAAILVVTLGVILIFTTILQYGSTVAQGAAEEKSNRVMEIMINAATPFQLMIGKIVGIGLAGFTQVAALAAAGIAAFLVQDPIKSAALGNASGGTRIDITSLSVGLLGLVVLYFVLGFMLYATLYAAVGSLVSRQEDVQSALAPLTFIFMAGYFVSIFSLNAGDAAWVKVISYIPFFTPTVMLSRVGNSSLSWWEIPLSVVIMIISIIVFTWLASRIYRAGVLMYGQKPSFRRIIKLAFSR